MDSRKVKLTDDELRALIGAAKLAILILSNHQTLPNEIGSEVRVLASNLDLTTMTLKFMVPVLEHEHNLLFR